MWWVHQPRGWGCSPQTRDIWAGLEHWKRQSRSPEQQQLWGWKRLWRQARASSGLTEENSVKLWNIKRCTWNSKHIFEITKPFWISKNFYCIFNKRWNICVFFSHTVAFISVIYLFWFIRYKLFLSHCLLNLKGQLSKHPYYCPNSLDLDPKI